MSATRRSIALVVKRNGGDRSRLLVIVDKKWTVGIFQSLALPAVGSVIIIEWRQHCEANTICVEKWEKYIGYEAMGGFDVNNTENEFTGMFYTTGCVRYNGVPLENPAIFNNYIGIVNDRSKILDEFYVGKLRATVTFVKEGDDYCWMLLKVVDYLKKEANKDSNDPRKYKGIVGAVNQGPREDGHYITSRFFPHDVRWFSRPNGRDKAYVFEVEADNEYSSDRHKKY
ncbi:unnamed protein product [Heligmosomoides polygyrus]|uniref:Dirigent protein n=1 Tax=Heligmosomoides polygyrus TaxID=6339 RepID=A0A3P7Y0E4_HELPZ|nr:unnamed protein product [Heligmosomoides polygyrus]